MIEKLNILLADAATKKFSSIRYGIKCCHNTIDLDLIADLKEIYINMKELDDNGEDACYLTIVEERINTL